jgi:gluconate kinase
MVSALPYQFLVWRKGSKLDVDRSNEVKCGQEETWEDEGKAKWIQMIRKIYMNADDRNSITTLIVCSYCLLGSKIQIH